MPMIRVATNLPAEKVPADFEIHLTDVLSESMNKPREVIGVELVPNARIVHGGTRDPVVIITVKSIGALSSSDTVRHTQKITELSKKELGLPPNKVVIDYVDVDPIHVGFDGTTVAAASS